MSDTIRGRITELFISRREKGGDRHMLLKTIKTLPKGNDVSNRETDLGGFGSTERITHLWNVEGDCESYEVCGNCVQDAEIISKKQRKTR